MDLISNRTIDITKLAMDGLIMRQKVTAANTANVITPGYQRKEVQFEDQLREIIEKEDLKSYIKEQNSLQYNPTSLDFATSGGMSSMTPQKEEFLKTNSYENYNPQIADDTLSGGDETGNNVEMEREVMNMAQTGLRYNVLADLEGKEIKMIAAAIKGDM